MIEEGTGSLLAANVEALVNAVNTVGVMGKGLALVFKKAFPDNYDEYRRGCTEGEVAPGRVFIVDRAPRTPRWIINFPTKRHWRDTSRIEDIRDGLADMVEQIQARRMQSVAVPALGCGLGGLEWSEVRPLIVAACGPLSARILVFPPEPRVPPTPRI